jgi:hypothetical protein
MPFRVVSLEFASYGWHISSRRLMSVCLSLLRHYAEITGKDTLELKVGTPRDHVSHHCCLLSLFVCSTIQAEVVDKLPEIRAECLLACPKQEDLYQACVKRITEKKEGDCESWFMEFLHCQDKCVAPKIFAATKE